MHEATSAVLGTSASRRDEGHLNDSERRQAEEHLNDEGHLNDSERRQAEEYEATAGAAGARLRPLLRCQKHPWRLHLNRHSSTGLNLDHWCRVGWPMGCV
jgi:hypothetical protein